MYDELELFLRLLSYFVENFAKLSLTCFFSRFPGKSIAVHTPSKRITTCEILPNGKYIVLALENEPNLVTLELKNYQINQMSSANDSDGSNEDVIVYGDAEFMGKTFQL